VDWEEKNSEEEAEVQETGEEQEEGITPEDEIETAAEREAREKREEEERQAKARKRRLIPPFVMLFAGAVVSITMRMLHYDLQTMLIVLLCVLLGFYFVGRILQIMLDRFEQQIQDAHMEEGEVIEKEPEE
jgi:Flp pilus assembly protein TadB